jgi:DNA-binding Lrp family transcriptional regulator
VTQEATLAAQNQHRDIETLSVVLAEFREAAALEEIEASLAWQATRLSRRTLIRRLAEMVERGTVLKSGVSRSARYRMVAGNARRPGLREPEQAEVIVPLSEGGSDVLRLVTRPEAARKPVGYNRGFLDGYRPNRSSYLSSADKARLAKIGRTAGAEQAAGTYAQQILNRLLIDLSWNSSRLEGSTYSLLDTQRLIELGEVAEGKTAAEAQMILNHKAAIEFLVQSAGEVGFNQHTILNLHALLADNLIGDQGALGRLRRERVGIAQSVYHPLEIPQLIEECFDQLLATAEAIRDPFEQAFFIMVQLPYLQPFLDVNKRVSRLAANIPLIKSNLAPLSFVAVPDAAYVHGILGVYELNRVELIRDVFLWAYERSSARYVALRQSLGDPDPFRMRHRAALRQVVGDVVRATMDQKAAAAHIAAWAARQLNEDDRARFIEAAETDLLGLHEGNFARYQVRPSEFVAWREVWERRVAHQQGGSHRSG